jgi:endonuclease/exonuclease/phosphatase family metal-dependent hydrolase
MRSLCIILFLTPYVPLAQTTMTISEARTMKTEKIVTVQGHVTAVFDKLAFIQDPTAAIAIYGAGTTINDSIRVTGKLSKFNGLLEIAVDSIKVLHSGLEPIKPKAVSSIIDREAELVEIQHVSVQPTGLFFYPDRGGITLKNSDTIHYWIDENTDIPGYSIPATSIMTGIVGRYGSQFQLMPRSHSDITNATIRQPTINNNFKVLNWNLEFFGAPKYGPSNDELQLTNVAAVLNSTYADLIALQEISSDDAFKDLIQIMPGYNGRCSNRYSYSFDSPGDFPPQKVCFIYKASTVKVIHEKILFRKYFDENPSDLFSSGRLPYLLEIEALGHRLNFVNIHAKSGAEIADRSRRESDARLLKDTLDHYQDVVLLGDFNDDVDRSIVTGYESPYKNFLDDHRYAIVTKSLSDGGWHSTINYDDVIDHQVISVSLTDYYLGSRIANPFLLIPLYGKTTSDHLPVMSEFDLTKTVTGLRDDKTDIFPNPTNGEIFLPPFEELAIFNSTGAIVMKKKGAQSPVSISDCASGLYTIIVDGQITRSIKH